MSSSSIRHLDYNSERRQKGIAALKKLKCTLLDCGVRDLRTQVDVLREAAACIQRLVKEREEMVAARRKEAAGASYVDTLDPDALTQMEESEIPDEWSMFLEGGV